MCDGGEVTWRHCRRKSGPLRFDVLRVQRRAAGLAVDVGRNDMQAPIEAVGAKENGAGNGEG
ncbi:hypothetical protein ATY77_23895 [Rhizobium sp. R634]|nr:hypothetical protein ATY77_23895 [Rhizobium sp. R634]